MKYSYASLSPLIAAITVFLGFSCINEPAPLQSEKDPTMQYHLESQAILESMPWLDSPASIFVAPIAIEPDGEGFVQGTDEWGGDDSILVIAKAPHGKILYGMKDSTIRIERDINFINGSRTVYETVYGHADAVTTLAIRSRESEWDNTLEYIASGSSDCTVRIWDCFGDIEHILYGHQATVNSVVFSRYDDLLASGSDDKTVKIWDTQKGELLWTLSGHTQSVSSVSFRDDGDQIASGSYDKTIKIWDTATGKEIRTIALESPVNSIAWSHDYKYVMAASFDNTVRFYNPSTGSLAHTLEGNYAVFSDDGKTVLTRSDDKTVRLWSYPDLKLKTASPAPESENNSPSAFSPDGTVLLSKSYSNIDFFDLRAGRLLHRVTMPYGCSPFWGEALYSPDGKYLVIAGNEYSYKSSSFDEYRLSNYFFWSDSNGRLFVFDANTFLLKHSLNNFRGGNHISPDSETILAGTEEYVSDYFSVNSLRDGQLIKNIGKVPSGPIYTPDGKYLASRREGKVWDTATYEPTNRLAFSDEIDYVIAFDPDGARYLGSKDKSFNIYETKSNRLLATLWNYSAEDLLHNAVGDYFYVHEPSWSPNGRFIACCVEDYIKIWDAKTYKLIRTIKTDEGLRGVAIWSPDGRNLASQSVTGKIYVWDAASGALLSSFRSDNDYHPNKLFEYLFRRLVDRGAVLSFADRSQSDLLDFFQTNENSRKGGIKEYLFYEELIRENINTADSDGNTMLHNGLQLNLKLYQIYDLILHGADLNSKNQLGLTPFMMMAGKLSPADFIDIVGRFRYSIDFASRDSSQASAFDYLSRRTGYWEKLRKLDPELAALVDVGPYVEEKHAETAKMETVLQYGHSSTVHAVSWSPDGKYFASASFDGTVKLWNATTNHLLRTFFGHDAYVYAVDWSPDGRRLVSGAADNTVKVWDAATGKLVRTYSGHRGEVLSVAFSPDGKTIASGSQDKTVKLWDAASGLELLSLNGHTHYVTSVAFSYDGNQLASASWDRTVKIWNIADGSLSYSLEGHSGSINAIAFSPNGKFLASAANDKTIKVWDYSSGRLISTLAGHEDSVASIAWDKNGARLASGGGTYDSTIKIWDIGSMKTLRTLQGHSSMVFSVRFNPQGTTLASASGETITNMSTDNTLRLWDVDSGRLLRTFSGPTQKIGSAAFSPDGRRLASTVGDAVAFSPNGKRLLSANDKEVTLWDLAGGRILSLLPPSLSVTEASVSLTPEKSLVLASYDSSIKLWDAENGKYLRSFSGHGSPVTAIAWSPNGKYFASASIDKTVRLWDAETGKAVKSFAGHSDAVLAVVFSPDGASIASGSKDGTVKIWDLEGDMRFTLFGHLGAVTVLAFTAGGKRLASGSSDGTIKIWDARRGLPIATLSEHSGPIQAIACNPEGDLIISGSSDNTVRLWDEETGIELKSFIGHTDSVNSVVWNPDGQTILSGSSDSSLRIWRIHDGYSIKLVPSTDSNWVIIGDDGLFDSSRDGGRTVAMVRGMESFNIDQFAARNNRPDLLLGQLGFLSEELTAHYYAQYRKRLRKLGLSDTDDISRSSFASASSIPSVELKSVTQTGKRAVLSFTLHDEFHELASYNIYINDVPLHGSFGEPISGRTQQIEETVELTYGENKIELSCMNDIGNESYRIPTYLAYDRGNKGDLYFLAFGVSRYRDSALDLAYADKDASDLAKTFSAMGRGFKKVYVKTYLNEDVTPENIVAAKAFLQNATVDDTFVLYIAGHGVYETSATATYYFLTHDADIKSLPTTSANFELIENLLQGIAPRNKLFLMDTCESGELDEATQKDFLMAASSRGIKARTIRGLTVQRDEAKDRARTFLYQKNRYIYNDLVRRSGAIVFSSSQGGEYSYESHQYANGHFTEEILNAFSGHADLNYDGMISTKELRDYVIQAVPKISSDLQHPTVDRDNIYTEFWFPVSQEPVF